MDKFKIGWTCRNLLAGLFMTCISVGPAMADEAPKPKKEFDVLTTFGSICGFCHSDSGRKAGKGPQLMNSERSDQYLLTGSRKACPGAWPPSGACIPTSRSGR